MIDMCHNKRNEYLNDSFILSNQLFYVFIFVLSFIFTLNLNMVFTWHCTAGKAWYYYFIVNCIPLVFITLSICFWSEFFHVSQLPDFLHEFRWLLNMMYAIMMSAGLKHSNWVKWWHPYVNIAGLNNHFSQCYQTGFVKSSTKFSSTIPKPFLQS